jgi:hypothetical protein
LEELQQLQINRGVAPLYILGFIQVFLSHVIVKISRKKIEKKLTFFGRYHVGSAHRGG